MTNLAIHEVLEQLTSNQQVEGSIPSGVANKSMA